MADIEKCPDLASMNKSDPVIVSDIARHTNNSSSSSHCYCDSCPSDRHLPLSDSLVSNKSVEHVTEEIQVDKHVCSELKLHDTNHSDRYAAHYLLFACTCY